MLQNAKVDLTAIYRLEFYKKQENWKFSRDGQEKKSENAK